MEEEKEMIDHWSHEHPLTLVDTDGRDKCYGCERRFSSGEQGYGCSVTGCKYWKLLHEECAAAVREIRHPLHTQHILSQRHGQEVKSCLICEDDIFSIGYKCTSSGCIFEVHLMCAHDKGVVDANHPEHNLKLWRRRCSFKCDACGITSRGSSYTCITGDCQYWIHERCASLPQTLKREDHHHSLSLSSYIPPEYIIYNYKCDVCSKTLRLKYWIYHCQICRFIVHIKCAFNKPPPRLTDASIRKDIVRLPMNEVAVELITPFVMRQRGGEVGALIPPVIIPAAAVFDELVNTKYNFFHHQHQLNLVSSISQHLQILGEEEEDEEEEEEEEEDEENYGVRSELICDGCITPISFSSSSSSSSSNSKCYYYYMSCSECKYNLHLACFHLPPQLSSLPLHQHDDHHSLDLRSCDKLRPWDCKRCSVCEYPMNGLFYSCTACYFKVDIQCACMLDTIHHAAHPQHLLNHVKQSDLERDVNSWRLTCASGCDDDIDDYDCYRCSNSLCDFIVHVRCAVLPASVTSRRWDERHPLLLTYDATLNRPGDFYCDQCETQMNPRSWMYRCRPCDISFHPRCFKTTSGQFRNIKLGQEYVIIDAIHPHPLTFQLLTTKRRCDICGADNFEWDGFYCALCNFFICFDYCGKRMIAKGDLKAVDLDKLSVLDH